MHLVIVTKKMFLTLKTIMNWVILIKTLMKMEDSSIVVIQYVVLVIQDLYTKQMKSILDSQNHQLHKKKDAMVMQVTIVLDLGLGIIIPTTPRLGRNCYVQQAPIEFKRSIPQYFHFDEELPSLITNFKPKKDSPVIFITTKSKDWRKIDEVWYTEMNKADVKTAIIFSCIFGAIFAKEMHHLSKN